MPTSFIAGFFAGMALIVAIGAQNSFVLRQGIRREHRLPLALICALADALLIAAGIAGLGLLIRDNPLLLGVARIGGGVFLLTYGFFAARRAWHGEQLAAGVDTPMSLPTAMATCLGFTFLNPHVYLDTVVLLGALASQHGASGRWVFGAGAATASGVWFFALAYGASLLAPLFRKPVAWRVLDSLIALIMTTLALALFAG